jgi:hypothetical protein
MLKNLLNKYYPQYLALTEFESIEAFENYYSKWWNERKDELQESYSFTDDGIEFCLYDKKNGEERNKLRFIKSSLQVSPISGNICKIINEKNSLEFQTVMFNNCISEIDLLNIELLEKKFLTDKYPFILDELRKIKDSLNTSYGFLIPKKGNVNSTIIHKPKIQWLGKTNLLTTLLYDLWQGQDNGSKLPSSKPLIKAQLKDLTELLVNNFIDEKGNPMKEKTISDYLNTSKPKKRAKKGVRLEIPI